MGSTQMAGETKAPGFESGVIYNKAAEEVLVIPLPVERDQHGSNDALNSCSTIETSALVEIDYSYTAQNDVVSAHLQVVMMMLLAMLIALLSALIVELAPRITVTTASSRQKEIERQCKT